jgi:serine/threonine-protein kinase RsbW
MATMSPSGADGKLSLEIGNSVADMQKVVTFVEQFSAAHGVPKSVSNDLNLCLDELLNNTISYGYDDGARHTIRVTLSCSDGVMTAEIQDDGRAFDPRAVPTLPSGRLKTRKLGGVGLRFVNSLMDTVDYEREGQYNIVKLKKKIEEGQSDGHR